MRANSILDPKSTGGSLAFVLALILVVTVLHYDVWNWGPDQWTFLAWPQEFLYRFALVTLAFPVINYLVGRVAWPMPDSDAGGEQ